MPPPPGSRWLRASILAGILGGGGLIGFSFLEEGSEPPPAYTGSVGCRDCHPAQYDAWKGSDHALALGWDRAGSAPFAPAPSDAVEVRPDGVRLSVDGHPFTAVSAIGIDPIVQYVAEFPGGRWQVLPLAFDARRKDWVDLTACPEAFAGSAEPAPWDSREAAANTACLFCHTTGYEKRYDLERDAYATRWAEAGVGCESCHGPAEPHARWQRENTGRGSDPFLGGMRLAGKPLVETCGACHARRMELDDRFRPHDAFADHYVLELLATGTYFADGRIRGEVYELGSFLQSRMHAKGITCNDCHDPHSGRTRLPGNALCLTCHETRFDTPIHTLHAAGSVGASCVACHMPAETFMRRDVRRDHSFSIPEPELTVRLGIPNACNDCHTDKTPQWASEHLRAAFGPADRKRIERAEAVAKGRARDPAAVETLKRLVRDREEPAIWRATHATLLAPFAGDPGVRAVLAGLLAEPDALIRMAATRAIGSTPGFPGELVPILSDTQRAVRHEAAAALAGYREEIPEKDKDAFLSATKEYADAQKFHADQPAGRFNLGLLHEALKEPEEAARWYGRALAIDLGFSAAGVNLGMLRAREGDKGGAETAFRQAMAGNPRDASAPFNLGLLLAESGRMEQAVASLERAYALDPRFPRAAYNLGLLLAETGRLEKAAEVLEGLVEESPTVENLWALAVVHQKRGDAKGARDMARRILAIDPAHAGARLLLE